MRHIFLIVTGLMFFVLAFACGDGSNCTESIDYTQYCRITGEMCVGDEVVEIRCDIESVPDKCLIYSDYHLNDSRYCENNTTCVDNTRPACMPYSGTRGYDADKMAGEYDQATLIAKCIPADELPDNDEDYCALFDED